MTDQALLEVAERVEKWYDDKGWGSPRDEAAQFAADIGNLLDHIASLTGNLRSPVSIQGTSPPSTRNGLPQIPPPYGYSTPEMDAAINQYIESKFVTPVSVIRSQRDTQK